MELSQYFKSVIDMDTESIVICNMEHTIVYMNPAAAKLYARWGGEKLVGRSLLSCLDEEAKSKIIMVALWFAEDKNNNRVYSYHNKEENIDIYIEALRDESGRLIGYRGRRERRTPESGKPYDLD